MNTYHKFILIIVILLFGTFTFFGFTPNHEINQLGNVNNGTDISSSTEANSLQTTSSFYEEETKPTEIESDKPWISGKSVEILYDFNNAYPKQENQVETVGLNAPVTCTFGGEYDMWANDGNMATALCETAGGTSFGRMETAFEVTTKTSGTMYFEISFSAKIDGGGSWTSVHTISSSFSVTSNYIDRNGITRFVMWNDCYVSTDECRTSFKSLNVGTGSNTFVYGPTSASTTITTSVEDLRTNIDYIYFSPASITSQIKSDYRNIAENQTQNRILVENFDYNNQFTVKKPLSWGFSSINPEATVTLSGNDIIFSALIPLTYEAYFTSKPVNSTMAILENSFFYNQDGFESGLNNWENYATNSFDSVDIDTTVSSNGDISLKVVDTDSTVDNLNAMVLDNGYYWVSFDYFIDAWDSGILSLKNYDGAWLDNNLDVSNLDRWIKSFHFLKIEGTENSRNVVIERSAVTGSATIYIDNFKIYKSNIEISTVGINQYLINTNIIEWDTLSDITSKNTLTNIKLINPVLNTIIQEWNTTTDNSGDVSVLYNGELEQQDYKIQIYTYSNHSNGRPTNIVFNTVFGQQAQKKSYNFDDSKNNNLINFDSDTTSIDENSTELSIISTGSDYWGFYDFFNSSGSYSISARVKRTGGAENYVGLTFYDKPASTISDDVILIRFDTSQIIFRVDGIETNPVVVTNSNQYYVIRIDVTDIQVKFYLDNVLIATRINTNSLLNPYFGIYGDNSNAVVDYISFSVLTDHQLLIGETQTYMTSINNTNVYTVYLDDNFIGYFLDLELIPLDLSQEIHNLTIIVFMTYSDNFAFIIDTNSNIEFIYDFLGDFAVSVYSFELSSFIISTFIVSNYNGNYTVYENDTSIGVGNFISTGTAVVTNRNLTSGVLFYYSVLFQNDTDQLWFNVTYSNAEIIIEQEFGLAIEGIVNPDYDFGSSLVALFVSTNWANTTIYVYQNDTLIGSGPEGQALVFTFNGNYGVWNFTFIINGTADYFIWEEWISIITPDLSLITLYYDIVVLDLEGYIFEDFPLLVYYNKSILSRNLLPLRGDEIFNSTLLTFGNDQSFNFQAHNITISQSASVNIFVVLVYIDILKIYFDNTGSYIAQLNVTSTIGDWSLSVNETIFVPQGGRSYWLPTGNYSAEIFEVVNNNITTSTGFISEMRVSSSLSLSGGERTYDASTTRLGAEIDNKVSILQDPFFAIGAGISSALLIFFVLNKVGDEIYLWFRTNILRRPRNEPLQFSDFKNIDINPTSNRAQNRDNRRRKRT